MASYKLKYINTDQGSCRVNYSCVKYNSDEKDKVVGNYCFLVQATQAALYSTSRDGEPLAPYNHLKPEIKVESPPDSDQTEEAVAVRDWIKSRDIKNST